MTTLRERIRPLLVSFALTDRACVEDKRDKIDREANLREYSDLILLAIKEELPNKLSFDERSKEEIRTIFSEDARDKHYRHEGYNACREEMEKRLE